MAKGKTTPAPEPKAEATPNRYLRASRIIVAEGCGIDVQELAVRAAMSVATAGHCKSAHAACLQALREAKLLPMKKPTPRTETPAEPEPVPAK